MPIQITCSRCQTTYAVDDDLEGKSIRCRGCDQPVRVEGPLTDGERPLEIVIPPPPPKPPSPAPPPPVEPWQRVVQPLGRSWRTVYSGLGLLKWSTLAALIALASNALVILIVLVALNQPPAGKAGGAYRTADDQDAAFLMDLTMNIVGLFAVLAPGVLSLVFSLVGRLNCCSVAADTGARLPAVLSFLGTIVALLLGAYLVVEVVSLPPRTAPPDWWLPAWLGASGVALLGEVLFLVFLYLVGSFLGEPGVGRRVLNLVLAAVGMFAIVFLGTFLLALDDTMPLVEQQSRASPPQPGTPAAQALTGVILVAALIGVLGSAVLLGLYLDLITVTRRALARRLAGQAASIPSKA